MSPAAEEGFTFLAISEWGEKRAMRVSGGSLSGTADEGRPEEKSCHDNHVTHTHTHTHTS